VIEDDNSLYYLLKVARHGFDIYCIPPHLGVHYSLHESGESHFRPEGRSVESENEPPVVLVMGEAGTPSGKGIIRAPLTDLGRASGICSAVFPIDSLSQDFHTFTRSEVECFVIDARLFPNGTGAVEVGVWAVPTKNRASFEFNNPGIPANMLYKATYCEPQIWVYARPF
jgi:hypothetical protein